MSEFQNLFFFQSFDLRSPRLSVVSRREDWLASGKGYPYKELHKKGLTTTHLTTYGGASPSYNNHCHTCFINLLSQGTRRAFSGSSTPPRWAAPP